MSHNQDYMDNIDDLEEMDIKTAIREHDEPEQLPAVVTDPEEQASRDMDEAVKSLKSIVDGMTPVLKDAADFARASDKGNAYESVAAIAKALIDANKTIVDIHLNKKKLVLDEKKGSKDSPEIQNNTQHNYYLSSDDLDKIVKDGNAITALEAIVEKQREEQNERDAANGDGAGEADDVLHGEQEPSGSRRENGADAATSS